jgi:hypothetical protein
MVKAVEHFGKRNGMDFSEAVRFLVECELNDRGYFRKDFEPGIVDTGESPTTSGARFEETSAPVEASLAGA